MALIIEHIGGFEILFNFGISEIIDSWQEIAKTMVIHFQMHSIAISEHVFVFF